MRLLTATLQRNYKIAILAASTCLGAIAADRIVDRVDLSRTVTVKAQTHPLAQPQFDRGAVDPAMEVSYATVLLKPAGGLEEFLAEQQAASSPNYHRWLTPEEFGARFGLSDSDAGKVVEWRPHCRHAARILRIRPGDGGGQNDHRSRGGDPEKPAERRQ